MEKHTIMCSVDGCYEVFLAQHTHSECPNCGISRAEIAALGTNDPKVIHSKKIDKEIDDLYNDALGG